MGKESLAALLFVGVLFVFFFWHRVIQLFHWLKGSQGMTYYLDMNLGDLVRSTQARLRTHKQRSHFDFRVCGSVIEIEHWLLRYRNKIYGSDPQYWQVADILAGHDSAVRIDLRDRKGLSVESVLRLINTYPSLQVMLDRIAELENSHKSAEARFQMVYAAVVALRFQILSDKQRYRGVVAQELRQDLDMVIEEINTLLTDHESLKVWEKRFQDHRDHLENISRRVVYKGNR